MYKMGNNINIYSEISSKPMYHEWGMCVWDFTGNDQFLGRFIIADFH